MFGAGWIARTNAAHPAAPLCRLRRMANSPGETDPDANLPAMFMLYGTTMLAVQGVENGIGWLYVIVNTDPHRTSNASIQRQWKAAFERLWGSFQAGSSGMRLNDAVTGLKNHLAPELYTDLQAFISTRRNQLAHRFLIERITRSDDGGARFASGSALELLEAGIEAKRLIGLLHQQADAVRATWPGQTEFPPPDVLEFMETVARMTTRKELPAEMAERVQARLREKHHGQQLNQGKGDPPNP